MKPGTKHSPAALARISEGTRRGLRPWHDGLRVLPQHVREYLARGQVAPSMKPMVTDTVWLIGLYAEELGGEDKLTPGQRVWLQKLFVCLVARMAASSRLLRDGTTKALEDVAFLLADERACLAALGLERVARQVPDLASYVTERSEDRAGATNGAAPGSEVQADA